MSMANDSISCVKEVTKNVPIALSISYQSNEIIGISDVLESWKRQYIQILQGIVVSYKNVSLLSKYAYIQSDNPVIQCNVKATFELFTPSVGSIVKGVINRISHDYIGCLVHNTINVAIHRFDNADDASNFIALDKVILFEITHLGYKRKVIQVKGKITQECVDLMTQLNFSTVDSSSTSNNRVIYSSNEYSDDSNINTGSHSIFNDATVVGKTSDYSSDLESHSPKKKSKKSKKELNTSSAYESVTENYDESQSLLDNNSRLTAQDLSDISHDSSKKKKKKSRKRDRSELSVDDSTETSFSQINNSIFIKEDISPKKKKLKKSPSSTVERNLFLNISEPQNLDDNSSETSSQSSSSKKKKHKKSKQDVLSSPSIFSDSLSSKDEIKPFKVPVTPPKKKKEKSPVKFSPLKAVKSIKDLSSLHETYEDTPSDLLTSMSPHKLNHEFSLHMDNLTIGSSLLNQPTETHFSLNDSALSKDKSSVSTKKAKKRKRESSGKDGSPKKKKKKLDSDGSKQKGEKSKKKSKDKSKKDSKKDKKKKPKIKVISSKKKLPKLKKKKKDKSGKLKNKSKKSKHKKEDVP